MFIKIYQQTRLNFITSYSEDINKKAIKNMITLTNQ